MGKACNLSGDRMNSIELLNHLRVIIKIHEIDEQKPNFLYWELKVLLEQEENAP